MKYIALAFLFICLKGYSQESKSDVLRVSVEVHPSFAYGATFELFQLDKLYRLNYRVGKDTLIHKGLIQDTSLVKAITGMLHLLEVAQLQKLTSEDYTDGTSIAGFIRRATGETAYFKSHSMNLSRDPVQKQLVQLCFTLALTHLQAELKAKRQLNRALKGIQENLVVMRLKETERHTIHYTPQQVHTSLQTTQGDTTLNNQKYKRSLIKQEFDQVKKIHLRQSPADTLRFDDAFSFVENCVKYFEYTEHATPLDSLVLDKLTQIAHLLIAQQTPILLTTGTEGNGGRGYEPLDAITRKYGFVYVTVGNLTCFPFRISTAIRAFNQETMQYLDRMNPIGWKETLEKEIENAKRTKYGK